MSDDIAEKMIEAWNEPFSTEHDPRELLVLGAKEIQRLRRELAARSAVIYALHAVGVETASALRATRLALVGVVLVAAATITVLSAVAIVV